MSFIIIINKNCFEIFVVSCSESEVFHTNKPVDKFFVLLMKTDRLFVVALLNVCSSEFYKTGNKKMQKSTEQCKKSNSFRDLMPGKKFRKDLRR